MLDAGLRLTAMGSATATGCETSSSGGASQEEEIAQVSEQAGCNRPSIGN